MESANGKKHPFKPEGGRGPLHSPLAMAFAVSALLFALFFIFLPDVGTKEFSEMKEGDTLEVMGPLGNGFALKEEKAIIIGGGIGIPPMLELAKQLNVEKTVVLGYRTSTFLKDEFEAVCDVKVATEDGSVKCSYYDYLTKHQDYPFWTKCFGGIKKLFEEKETRTKGKAQMNPYMLSKKQDDVASAIRKDISISIDKKTAVITISTEAQDPLICKTLADSVKERLQVFITNYRTSKARVDEQYYNKLTTEAKQDCEKARQLYGAYSDANTDVILASMKSKQEDLENDMQLKFNAYNAMMTQYQAAKAKVQERTPAFTVVQGAAVPIKPSGPKRMLFVACMIFLAFFILSIYSIKDLLLKD